MEDKDLNSISKKLSILVSLSLENNEKFQTNKEKVAYLKPFGLNNSEVAEILATSKNNIEVIVNRLKQRNKS